MTNAAPPLDGITALDFSHALAGPYCATASPLLGADTAAVLRELLA